MISYSSIKNSLASATLAAVSSSPPLSADDGDDIYRIDRSVLLSIAKGTPLDVGLQRMVQQRPLVAEIIADQVLWMATTSEKLRQLAKIPKHLRPLTVDDLDTMSQVTASTVHQPSIVLVGCGFVGSRIADRLLESRSIHPSSLYIMTRQPESLSRFAKAGVLCGHLKPEDVSGADLVIIATLPGQLSTVSKSLKGHLKASAVVISVCAGVVVEKVCSEFQHPLCLVTDVDILGCGAAAASLGDTMHSTSLRSKCEETLLRHVMPPYESISEWLSRIAFVLANAGTALGAPFHFALFAAWGFITSESCRMQWRTNYKDHMCPPASDVARMEFGHLLSFSEKVGLPPEELIASAQSKMKTMLRQHR